MAKIGVSLKIDVTKIDKARLFKGEKGTYLDCTAFIDINELDQYGNSGMITQNVSKEEREQGVKGNILGNSKVFFRENTQQVPANPPSQQFQQPAPQQAPPTYQQAQANHAQQPPQAPQAPFMDDDLDSIPF